jgi:uncharacterized protein (DUF2164 family)
VKPIAFSREERADMAAQLRDWSKAELDEPLTGLQAEMLLDLITERFGAAFYNRALYDVQTVVATKAEDTVEAIFALERRPIGR